MSVTNWGCNETMSKARINVVFHTNILVAFEQFKKRVEQMVDEFQSVGFIVEPCPVPAIIDATDVEQQ